jgi:hypothetical protein
LPEPQAEPQAEPPTEPPSTQPQPEPSRERSVLPPAGPPPLERVAEAPSPEPQPIEPAPAAESSAAPPAAPSRALATHEEDSVRRQLASWTGKFNAEEPQPTLTWRDDGQEYRAVLKRLPAVDAMGMEQLSVELTTERGGERLATELRMSRLAFSNFGQFVNRWDPEVGLNDDVIDGRFHSNSELTISREGRKTPVFLGKVTIAGNGFVRSGPGYLSKRKLFPAGIETGTRRIALPERAAALDEIARSDNSQRFARDAALTFHDDGTVSWHERGGGPAERRRALGEEPFYLLASEDVELEVSGTVNGKVLVYTPERIVVTGHLRYAVDPRTPNADDYLGLVAERSVEIAEPDVTGPGDLEIFASIYARQRFVVRSFQSRRSGTLIVHGSLTAGTLSASEPRYATRVEFDNRLTTMRAPSFPLSDRYELDAATGDWRVVGAAN